MGSIHLLLGKSRRRRRRALPGVGLSGVDTHGRPSFLYVTDTQRKARVVEREFLEQRAEAPVFAPDVRVLSDLLGELWQRHGSGLAILSRRVCALAAEQLLLERGEEFPWLASLGRAGAIGEALAELLRTVGEARGPALQGFPRAPELADALAALASVLDGVPGHIRESEAHEALLGLLEHPTPPLKAWLGAHRTVILDDILMPSPLRRALLVGLCRAWAAAGAEVVISFETGRDLGGREAGLFFGYDDVDEVAYPLKPFAATRRLRREVFEAVVAQGDGEILVGLDEGIIRLDPAEVPEAIEDRDLTDWMYASEPVPFTTAAEARSALLGDTVRFVRCADAESELRTIARSVKRALLDGARPDECVVALPDLATYGPALRAVFEDHGIPYALSAGTRLSHSPIANALRRIATVGVRGWPVEEVLTLLRSDLFLTPDELDPARLLGWCRAAGVGGGEPATWRAPIRQWVAREGWREGIEPNAVDAAITAVEEAIQPLRGLAQPSSPDAWGEALLDVADHVGLTSRLAHCPSAPEVAAENMVAWGAVLRAVEALVRDLQVIDSGVWAADELANHLDRALQSSTYSRSRASLAHVQVVGVLELRGLTPTHTWLGGLARGSFPAGSSRSFLVPSSVQRRLEPVDRLAESRYLFCSLLRNALDDPRMRTLTLSWPATVGGRNVPPAPVLADLLSVPTAIEGTLLGDWLVESPPPPLQPLAHTDLLRGAASNASWLALADESLAETLHRQRLDQESRSAEAFGPHDGMLTSPSPRPARLSVSHLDTYVKCPIRYWLGAELRLREAANWDPELGPQRRGEALHLILQRFIEAVREQHGQGFTLYGKDPETLRPLLARVAQEVVDQERARGGFDPALFDHDVGIWMSGLTRDEPRGVLLEWLLSETGDWLKSQPQSIEERYVLKLGSTDVEARIDRVDQIPRSGIRLVLDYKTGGYPRKGLLLRGLAMQPVLYAEAIARAKPGQPVVTAWSLVGRPNEIKRKGFVGPSGSLATLYKQFGAEVLEESDRSALVAYAAEAIDHMAAGWFHPTLATAKEAGCRTCAFRRVCRIDDERNRRIADTSAPGHRPRDASSAGGEE